MNKEIHIVKRAIILAAGIGTRMQPLTFETPKPLIEVNGVRMIDTVIQGLLINGITEIYGAPERTVQLFAPTVSRFATDRKPVL